VTVIEITPAGEPAELTFRQRWNHYLALIFAAVGLFIGVNLRDSILNATTLYVNTQAGITAQYPQNWLIDTEGNYIFRVRDISQVGFKTTIQITVQPVSASTSNRNIFDALTLSRAPVLAAYRVLSIDDTLTLPDETPATSMTYTFAATESDPFLESVPVIVQGQDILTIKRGQAIIITFLSDSTTYESNYPFFQQFLNSLEF
jgi:hypothetical protein